MNIRHITSLAAAAFAALTFAPNADAHCQIPCGIYADDNVIDSADTRGGQGVVPLTDPRRKQKAKP
jgi:hypothetical protein